MKNKTINLKRNSIYFSMSFLVRHMRFNYLFLNKVVLQELFILGGGCCCGLFEEVLFCCCFLRALLQEERLPLKVSPLRTSIYCFSFGIPRVPIVLFLEPLGMPRVPTVWFPVWNP